MESQHNNESNCNLTYKKFNMLYIDKNEKRKRKAFRRHICTQDILKPNQWMIDHKIVFRTRRERYNILLLHNGITIVSCERRRTSKV